METQRHLPLWKGFPFSGAVIQITSQGYRARVVSCVRKNGLVVIRVKVDGCGQLEAHLPLPAILRLGRLT